MQGDIVEKETSDAPAPPSAPKVKHLTKKWVPRKRAVVLDPEVNSAAGTTQASRGTDSTRGGTPRATAAAAKSSGSTTTAQNGEQLSDAERIHLENIRKIQKMTPEEIEREREEIFRAMDPDVLQSLLRRAEIKEAENMGIKGYEVKAPRAPPRGSMAEWDPSGMDPVAPSASPASASHNTTKPAATLATAAPGAVIPATAPTTATPISATPDATTVDAAPTSTSSNTSSKMPHEHSNSLHFPPPPEELRKYFPDLPVETEKLAWMQPVDDTEEAEYSSELASVAPSELRFDFKGNLITPRVSRLIPSTAGLHHHGDAPAAAGYTLPELAHLARSSHNAQRAMAIQTAGRVLHKLKMKKFNRSSDLQEGLNALVMHTRIMDTLAEAADESTRSITVRTVATEALWLANAKPS